MRCEGGIFREKNKMNFPQSHTHNYISLKRQGGPGDMAQRQRTFAALRETLPVTPPPVSLASSSGFWEHTHNLNKSINKKMWSVIYGHCYFFSENRGVLNQSLSSPEKPQRTQVLVAEDLELLGLCITQYKGCSRTSHLTSLSSHLRLQLNAQTQWVHFRVAVRLGNDVLRTVQWMKLESNIVSHRQPSSAMFVKPQGGRYSSGQHWTTVRPLWGTESSQSARWLLRFSHPEHGRHIWSLSRKP